jgi:hypothetical protein
MKVKLSEVLLPTIHSSLYLNAAEEQSDFSNRWALRATTDFDEPEYN